MREEAPKAVALFRRAIEMGEKQMKQLPKTDFDARQQLDEAIGDAWQNLGVYYLSLKKMEHLAEAEKCLRRSLKHYAPNGRRVVQRHLRAIDQVKLKLEAERRRREGEQAEKEKEKKKPEVPAGKKGGSL